MSRAKELCQAPFGRTSTALCAPSPQPTFPAAGDLDVTEEAMVAKASSHFGVTIPKDIDLQVVYVRKRSLLDAARYPRFTMLGQSLGSMLLAWECLQACTPDIFVDTTGWASTFLVAKLLAGCKVACYVHYPTITSDMLQRVHERRPGYNNSSAVSGSALATWAKVM